MNFFTILHFLKQENLNVKLSWLQGDNTCCDQMVSALNLTPQNNNYQLSIFNPFRAVPWPPSDHTTIWSISQYALFEIWQVCSILLESWSYHSIGYPLFVGHAHKLINQLTRAILNFWVQWLCLSLSNTIHQKPWKQSECCN